MRSFLRRCLQVAFGLTLFALGTYFSIQANVGLAPWVAFSMGISGKTGFLYGNVTVVTSFVILAMDILLKEKIGVGTILDAILVGKLTDLFQALELIPQMTSFLPGVAVLLLGQVILCVGSYFYMSPGLGCGPRDTLMVALGKRLPKVPIGLVRGLIEGGALLVGWALGAKVGLGTVISVFGIGFILELTFKVMHFDATAVTHESLLDSWKGLRGAKV